MAMTRSERCTFACGVALLAAFVACSSPPSAPRIAESGNATHVVGARGGSARGATADGGTCQGSLETSGAGATPACGKAAPPSTPGAPSYVPTPSGHSCTFDHECAAGNWCSRTTHVCEAVRDWGMPCTDDAECGHLACVGQDPGRQCGLPQAPCTTVAECNEGQQMCESATKHPCLAACTKGFCEIGP